MKISYNWLKSFVDFDMSPEELAEMITRLSFECEGIEHIQRNVNGVLIGKVLESEKHPNADKLAVTKVDVGSEILDVVCGAPNCRKGLTVAIAPPGTQMGDFEITSRKLRGVVSNGMILSENEMGISENHDGILELSDSLEVGSEFSKLVSPEDHIIEFEITVNRPDGLSHFGIAREVAAKLNKKVIYPDYSVVEGDLNANDLVTIDIQNPKQCPRYSARYVAGVKVGQSPLWMKALLHSLGQRPLNNIVDVTNFVLFEIGHPIHAFDYNLVKDGHVVVRNANQDEVFTTLDGVKRKLDKTDLLIADKEKGIGLAGVMGGENTEVNEDTENILIEAAYFDPPSTRKSSKRHSLQTEAARRFERGADPSMPPNATSRVAKLIQEFAGGTIAKGIVDAYPSKIERDVVSYRSKRAEQILGVPVTKAESADIFSRLELKVEEDGDNLKVQAPTFRHDIEREIDLIEEVIRIKGYDQVPTATESRIVLNAPDHGIDKFIDSAVETMVAMGFREAIHPGMTSGEDQELFAGNLKPYVIFKPINPEMNVYRSSMLPALIRSLARNLNHGIENVRLFEQGQLGGKGWFGREANQGTYLSFVIAGDSINSAYDRSNQAYDLYDLKGVMESLMEGLSLDKPLKYSYDIPDNLVQGFSLKSNKGEVFAQLGQLSEEVAENFGIDKPVYLGEVDIELLNSMTEKGVKRPGTNRPYSKFSRFPASHRDIAVIVPQGIFTQQIEEVIRESGGKNLEQVVLFDLYEGKPLNKGERSLAYRLTFRSFEKTLTDKKVDADFRKVINKIQQIEGVQIRS